MHLPTPTPKNCGGQPNNYFVFGLIKRLLCSPVFSVAWVALHELDFFLYFSLENSKLSCVTVSLQHICSTKKKKKKKKPVIFIIWYPFNYIHVFTSKIQINHWNMLYNVHTCIAIFFHISYNPVSTHSINQNSYYKLCFTKIHKL